MTSRRVGRSRISDSWKTKCELILILLAIVIFALGQSRIEARAKPAPGKHRNHKVSGALHGGRKPIGGSTVTLWAVGTTGYGSARTSINSTVSDAAGNWNMTVSCPTGSTQVYLTATGGDAGAGVSNAAIALMYVLGPCGSLPSFVNIGEISTVASVWAMAQFMDSTGFNIGAPSTNAAGLKNAAATVNNLADLVSGRAATFMSSGFNSPLVLNTLADIVARCVNSANATSLQCSELMCEATPGLTFNGVSCSGTPTPTDTLGAAHLISVNPHNNVSNLFTLAVHNSPFKPSLSAAPDGWEIALNYAPAGAAFNGPNWLALDASGNVFVANFNGFNGGNIGTVSELTASSAFTVGSNFTAVGAAFNQPQALALDTAGNIWVSNCGTSCSGSGNSGSVSELTAGSGYATGNNFAAVAALFNNPLGIALDASSNVWTVNFTGVLNTGSVSELTAASSYLTGLNFAAGGAAFSNPGSIAFDSAANVWVANSGSVGELTASSGYLIGAKFAPVGAALDAPGGITLDASSNVWLANFVGTSNLGSVSELTASSAHATGLNFAATGAAFNQSNSVAVDASGNLWVANSGGTGSVSELTAGSSYATGFNFSPSGAGLSAPFSIALDASGNVWVVNNGNFSVTEMLGLAKPVVTPIQSCLIFEVAHPGQACLP
jgi:hypothetical protein